MRFSGVYRVGGLGVTEKDVSHIPTQLLCEVTGPILLQLSWFQLVYYSLFMRRSVQSTNMQPASGFDCGGGGVATIWPPLVNEVIGQ